MDYLDQQGKIVPGSRTTFLGNHLVLIVPASVKGDLTLKPGVNLARLIGDQQHTDMLHEEHSGEMCPLAVAAAMGHTAVAPWAAARAPARRHAAAARCRLAAIESMFPGSVR